MTDHVQPYELSDYLHRALTDNPHAQVRAHLDDCTPCWDAWNRFRWDQARPTRLYADLAEFLGQQFQPYFDSSRALAHEWDTANPRTDSEIRDFFRASTSYLYNLVIWEASGNRPDYLSAALPVLHRLRPRCIIDYGCGIGSDTLALLEHGYAVIPCDFHSPSTAFLRWRAARAGITLTITEPHRLTTYADAVWIIDTLDHLNDLDRQLGSLLPSAGLLVCENLINHRAHGQQHFHHRRTPDQIALFLARYGFSREQTTEPHRHSPIATWQSPHGIGQ